MPPPPRYTYHHHAATGTARCKRREMLWSLRLLVGLAVSSRRESGDGEETACTTDTCAIMRGL